MLNRRSGDKMFLSVITAPLVLAHLIDFLIKRYYVMFEHSSCKFDPPRLLTIKTRLRQYIKKVKPEKKLAALRLFVETMPIY